MAKVTQLVGLGQGLNWSPNGAPLIIPILSCSSGQASKPPRGLPWWCVLVGWLLVAATSGVAAFFTMLLWPALRAGQPPQVAHLHGRLLRGECVCHPAPEGQDPCVAALLPSFPPPMISLLPAAEFLGFSNSFIYSIYSFNKPTWSTTSGWTWGSKVTTRITHAPSGPDADISLSQSPLGGASPPFYR